MPGSSLEFDLRQGRSPSVHASLELAVYFRMFYLPNTGILGEIDSPPVWLVSSPSPLSLEPSREANTSSYPHSSDILENSIDEI